MTLLHDLNAVQQEAVKAANGPVMIVAGAGSGKTRVLTYRIAYLVSCGVPPYQILALTFTNKAANEMKSRIIKLVGPKADGIWMGTFHSMFARVLRKESEKIGFTRSFTIYDSDDSLSLIKRCMEEIGISLQQVQPTAIRSRISAAKNQLVGPKEFDAATRDPMDEKAALVYHKYQQKLFDSNAMDFDDLLVRPIELFEQHPAVLEKYHERFKFILVDEYQDTNRAQYQVTKSLGARYRNICVVGDDAQSIYSFRGADIRNILDFTKDYSDCQTFRLEQNYRSTKNILGAADQLIRNNVDRLQKNLWTQNEAGEPVEIIECVDERDEGHRIASLIEEHVSKQRGSLSDCAVLYRTNSQSRALEDALRRGGVPYVIVGGTRFYERKEIKDILAYLRLLVNQKDEESLLRAINYPARGIGDVTLEKTQEAAQRRGETLFESLRHASEIEGIGDRTKKSLLGFHSLILKYVMLQTKMSLSEVVRALVDELGILRMFKDEGTVESMARWENVQELLSAISEFGEEHPEGRLEDFLQEVSLVSDIDTLEGTKNAVTLMTLHSSKGLEFPVVFISGLEEGLLPFYNGMIERQELEEERRLFYVGMTRAQKRLFITRARSRYRYGDLSYASESRFLTEIGESEGIRRNGAAHSRSWTSLRARRSAAPQRTLADVESYFEDSPSEFQSESSGDVDVKKGNTVDHTTFGRGRVIEVSGKGESKKAVVQFDEYGMKTLILKFANLKRV